LTISPNPSSGKFLLTYSLTQESSVSMRVLDITGRQVMSQDFGLQPAGQNEEEFDLHGMADGAYFARLKTAEGEKTIKLLLKK